MLLGRSGGNASETTVGQYSISLAVIFKQGFITNVLNPKVALSFWRFCLNSLMPTARQRSWPSSF